MKKVLEPIRYSQCFDELIRQVAINSPERGLLLLRVRDEIRMTIAAYQTLYESSIAFGMRKALQAEQGKADMEARIKQLEAEKKDLERQVQELKANTAIAIRMDCTMAYLVGIGTRFCGAVGEPPCFCYSAGTSVPTCGLSRRPFVEIPCCPCSCW